MRVLALDYGSVRVGVAITDDLGLLAHPRPPIPAGDPVGLLDAIAALTKHECVDKILVGLPLDPRGTEGFAAKKARAFAVSVRDRTGCPTELWDERFSTTEAHRRLRESGHNAKSSRRVIDGAAACIMLQAWIESQVERST